MLSRLIQFVGLIAVITALAGYGVAHADAHENPCGDDNPCSDGGDDTGGDDTGGDDTGGGDAGGGDAMVDGGMAEASGGSGMTLPKGKLALHVALGASLNKDFAFKPFSLSPDVHYGVSDKLTVSLIHSEFGGTGFWRGAGGTSLCLAGSDNGCADVYGNVGANAVFALSPMGKIALAVDGGIYVGSFDPFALSVKLGVKGQWSTGKITVMFNPNIGIGLTERDAGNKEVLSIPVDVLYAVNPKLGVGVQTGIQGLLDGFGDSYRVPLGLGANYAVNPKLTVGGAFNLDALINGFDAGAADLRSLTIFAGYLL